MKTFAYTQAADANQALDVAARGATYPSRWHQPGRPDEARCRDARPGRRRHRAALDFVTEMADGGLQIGATVRNSDLAAHPLVRRKYPVLAEALLAGASGQLRNMATTAGNLLQRTRCLYFQDVTKPCNKRVPGSGCPARTGEHRGLAVLGASDACIATHPSDMAVALAALDAVVHVQQPDGPSRGRRSPTSFGCPATLQTSRPTLPPGTLVTAVWLPPMTPAMRSTYRKVRDRASYAFAIVSVAAALEVTDPRNRARRPAGLRRCGAQAVAGHGGPSSCCRRPRDAARPSARRSRPSSRPPSRCRAMPSRFPCSATSSWTP